MSRNSFDQDAIDAAILSTVRGSTTFIWKGDANVSKGTSDAGGDLKDGEMFWRSGKKPGGYHDVLGVSGRMVTPQKGAGGKQFDTGEIRITAGRETETTGVYVSVGQTNGKSSKILHDIIDAGHHAVGMGDSRKSPASSTGHISVQASGRVDRQLALGSSHISLNSAAFGTLGTDKIAAGGAALISIGTENRSVRPDVPDLPTIPKSGSGVYAGIDMRKVAKDITTDRLGTTALQSGVVVGVHADLGKNASVFAEARKEIFSPVEILRLNRWPLTRLVRPTGSSFLWARTFPI